MNVKPIDVLGFAGVLSLLAGIALVFVPAALIVAGVLGIYAAVNA